MDSEYEEIHFPIADLVEDDEENGDVITLLSSEEEEAMDKAELPNSLPILPLRNTVLYPGVVIPITVGRDKSIKLINDAYKQQQKIIGCVAQKSQDVEDPDRSDLFEIGTMAQILKMLRLPDGNTTVIIQGKRRFSLGEVIENEPYMRVEISPYTDKSYKPDKELAAMIEAVKESSTQIIELSPNLPSEASMAIKNIDSPTFLIHFVASNLDVDIEEKQKLLETKDFKQRCKHLLKLLSKEKQLLELKHKITDKVKIDLDKQQRDYFLQQQLKAIQEELGEESHEKEVDSLKARALKKKWPQEVGETFNKEWNKLRRMNPVAGEFSVVSNYLELLLEMPWQDYTTDSLELEKAKQILDKDHFGLDKIKDRILEYLAVLQLKGDMKSPILCLYGPPGVGKTSLGKSIARAMGREYTRMSLGGLHDEAEIRGHRRTYIGAMPGRIIQGIKKAKTSNPVFILDEIDKIGSDFRGDPASALLEVLDPEQNNAFFDNYLELEYDLSKVLFIATANTLDTMHPALRDRLEIIELSGYLMEEKIQIAKHYLIPKQRSMHGLKSKDLRITSSVLEDMVENYTRESGVRTLEKKIASLARYRAKEIVGKEDFKVSVNDTMLLEVLGPPPVVKDLHQNEEVAGVSTGLAWTPAGGDVLYVEVALTPGSGKLTLTGKLGEVMKESAMTALTYLKSRHEDLNIRPSAFKHWDVHVHVPEGAVPKEGPSAGITLFTALASAFTQRKVKKGMAMTGEMTLRGKVLPVGGIKEKLLAAKRYSLTDILLCKDNKKDVHEIKKEYLEGLTIHFVSTLDDVIEKALLADKIKLPINVNEPAFASNGASATQAQMVTADVVN